MSCTRLTVHSTPPHNSTAALRTCIPHRTVVSRRRTLLNPGMQRWTGTAVSAPNAIPVARLFHDDHGHEDPPAAGGREDDQVHRQKHQVVVPPAGLLSPEPCFPLERLLLDRSEADEDQAERGRLDEDPGDQADARQGLRGSEPPRRGGAQLDALRAPDGVFEMEVA